ncbi:MAG TPA: hypothetical protein DCW72_07610 [Elusimicrobia bacterium]|nr:MAG: hypothetical protein A2X29_05720 [Elusimicrobia bacterium GWA2_64_40]OGR67030.1 MAG: hypothetical protein A2X30_06090 [Elusimicrobia bacterium GWB2_63_16]HAN03870.1 hypothetical protein [Elusimicrobiota bacterium]HAU90078.1 hypothetical protein [Elusimicrobiota bacterium]
MTKYLLPLLLALCPAAYAAENCAKNSDACVGTKVSSPFAAASLREPLPPAAPGSGGKKAALRQAAPAPAAEPVQAPAEPEAKPAGEQLGSPLWLLFVGGVLAGLYFYLGAGRKKGRRK